MRVIVDVAAAVVGEMPRRRVDGFATASRVSPTSDWPDSDTHDFLIGNAVASAANTLVPIPNA